MADVKHISVSQEMIRKMFDYDELTGQLTRKVARSNRVCAGHIVAGANADGYFRVTVGSRRVYVHRLVWAIVYGEWPTEQIDHINGNKQDNRIANLRLVGFQGNAQNLHRAKASNITTGVLGVGYDGKSKRRKRYTAKIMYAGKSYHLGRFNDAQSAHQAYLTAKRRLHVACTI